MPNILILWEAIKAVGGCIAGVIGWAFLEISSRIVNRGQRQHLSDRTKQIMSEFFPALDMNDVVLRTKASLAIPSDKPALVLGNTIFIRGGFDECRVEDMALLMHELVHVDQYRKAALGRLQFACEYGAGYLREGDYELIPLEQEAIAFASAKRARLSDVVTEVCAEALAESSNRRLGWFWLVWGSG